MMRRNCCHVSVAFVVKLLNYLQAFVGVSIVLYSVWMLDEWAHRVPVSPPPFPAPSPSSSAALLSLSFDFESLPAPWFIYSFMGFGIILCCVTLIGCIAAESIHGCCLCFYTIVKTALILSEAALIAFIAFDHHWEQDLPTDPTGELEGLRSFIEKNIEICKWIGITVISIQVLALLLAMLLRCMVSPRRTDWEDKDDYESVRGRTREPLLNHAGLMPGSATLSDIWSSRMRAKHGLNSSEKHNHCIRMHPQA